MEKNKINREEVIKNLINNSDPTGELLKGIYNNVYNSDNGLETELKNNKDKFLSSLSQTLKSIDLGFSGDITGSLYKYLGSNGSPQELQKLKSLVGNMGVDQGIENSNFLSMAYLSYSTNIQKYKDLDLLVGMVPQLQDALDTLADSILASDNFNNLVSFKCDDNIMDIAKNMDTKYDFYDNLRKVITDGLKYGYGYTSVIQFKEAFKQFKLTNKEYKDAYNRKNKINESDLKNLEDSLKSIQEAAKPKILAEFDIQEKDLICHNTANLKTHAKTFLESVTFCDSNEFLLESSNYEQLNEVIKQKNDDNKIKNKFKNARSGKKDKKIKRNDSDSYVDGLIQKDKIDLSEDEISGCIIKHLDIKRLIPIKVDDTILGYYYIEDTGIIENTQINFSDPMMALSSMNTAMMQSRDNEIERANGEYFKQLSDILVTSMIKDKNFLKNNTRFKEQVYSIIRYGNLVDKTLKITYLKPDQVVEFGKGESIIARSLFYGKLYLALLMTNIMIKVSRGYDKRIYLVKSAVAPEVGDSTLSAIKEIKKDQKSVTMLKDVNSVLNLSAKTADLFIPMDQEGNKTIDYDVMSGQDISLKDELLEFLEDRMLSGTGVPTPLLQATSETDFSRTLVLLNSKFLRRVLRYQRLFNNPTCVLFNYVNAADLGLKIDSDEYEILIVEFLPPAALGISSMNEQVGNAKDLVDIITRAYTDSGLYGDAVPGEFSKEMLKYLCSILPWDRIDSIFNTVIEQTTIKSKMLNMTKSDNEGM